MNKRDRAFAKSSGKCFYCGCNLDFKKFHLDHFIPKSNGGSGLDNYVAACPTCNMYKYNLSIEEFRDKIATNWMKDISEVMLCKYMDVDFKPVVFYFEKENLLGDSNG